MLKRETKNKHGSRNRYHVALVTATVIFLGFTPVAFAATDYSSANFTVKAPVIDSGFESSGSANFGLGQSLTQTAIGKSNSANFQLWSGFQYFFKVNPNVLTPTAGDGQVALSWTVPSTFLGITVSNYQLGTGVVSGSYSFQSLGNVTSFVKSGLTNGTPYFFIIKAESIAGTFLTFSNEATATPAAGGGGGGGGGGGNAAVLILSGQAYPNSNVTIIRDSNNVSTATADSSGHFQVSILGLNPGTYNFLVFATDVAGHKSANRTFSATMVQSVSTTVNNLILSPSLSTDYSIIKKGENLSLHGYAAPNSQVNLSVDSTSTHLNFNVISDSAGKFDYQLNTGNLAKTAFVVKAHYIFNSNNSPDSLPVNFSVGDRDVPIGEGCSKRSDLNCDGRVNLIDFSILLFYWDKTEFAANPRVDIDQSGKVGLTDFSIMLYDWTG